MTKADRQKIFEKYGGRCAYCGCELNTEWQVDHAVSKNHWMLIDPSDPKKVDTIENLMPACKECNHYKRSHCIESSYYHIGFRDFMGKFHIRYGKLPKNTRRTKTAKTKLYMQVIAAKYNITAEKPFSGKFYFETIQQHSNGNNN